MKHRRGHTLRRRYGRARGHLPLSQLSLDAYESSVDGEIRHGTRHAATEDERLMVLEGWRAGRQPIIIALDIEKHRRGR